MLRWCDQIGREKWRLFRNCYFRKSFLKCQYSSQHIGPDNMADIIQTNTVAFCWMKYVCFHYDITEKFSLIPNWQYIIIDCDNEFFGVFFSNRRKATISLNDKQVHCAQHGLSELKLKMFSLNYRHPWSRDAIPTKGPFGGGPMYTRPYVDLIYSH